MTNINTIFYWLTLAIVFNTFLFTHVFIYLFIYINIFFLADFPAEVSSLSLPSDHSLPERCRVTGCDNFAAFDRHGHCDDCFKRFYPEVIYREKFTQRQISEISGGSNWKSFMSFYHSKSKSFDSLKAKYRVEHFVFFVFRPRMRDWI